MKSYPRWGTTGNEVVAQGGKKLWSIALYQTTI